MRVNFLQRLFPSEFHQMFSLVMEMQADKER